MNNDPNLELIKELVGNGENVNSQDIYGRTCLHLGKLFNFQK